MQRRLAVIVVGILGLTAMGWAQQTRPDDIDWDRARAIYQREQRGERLSADDREYLQRARALRQKMQGGVGPARESVGLVPLNEMPAGQKYKGFSGGLYGDGRNEPPEAQEKLAAAAAGKVTPLNEAGNPAADGKIVLLSIGMSNTTQEFSRFKQIADRDGDKSQAVTIADGAQGGKDAEAWAAGADKGTNPVWEEAGRRIRQAGATPQQVQVVWIKQAIPGPARYGSDERYIKVLADDLAVIVRVARQRYPNLKLAYLSSRIYGGYASTPLNPEPWAYDSAFSVQRVIVRQIEGDGELNADPAKGEVKSPVLLWGPYLWADGTKGRKADDLVWRPEDFGPDGTHPAGPGRQKVAELLLRFFKTDPTAKVWFCHGA